MITIDAELCSGCAACVEVCPSGALYLVEGKATVERTLCRDSEACLAACPTGAITLSAQEEPVPKAPRTTELQAENLGRSESNIIQIRTLPAPLSLRSRALPMVGAALAWAGREILPRLADTVLYTLDRKIARRQAQEGVRGRETCSGAGEGGGRRRQHRRRRGGGSRRGGMSDADF